VSALSVLCLIFTLLYSFPSVCLSVFLCWCVLLCHCFLSIVSWAFLLPKLKRMNEWMNKWIGSICRIWWRKSPRFNQTTSDATDSTTPLWPQTCCLPSFTRGRFIAWLHQHLPEGSQVSHNVSYVVLVINRSGSYYSVSLYLCSATKIWVDYL